METVMAQPSIKQALNRMNSGHFRVLEALAGGNKVVCGSDATWLGFRKCASTLSHWGAIEGGNLTQYGNDLHAAARASVRPRFVQQAA